MDDQVSQDTSPEVEERPRRERRERKGEGWIGGMMLILLGLIFLLNNAGVFSFDNWWALFILLPAFGAFGEAWKQYRSAGRFSSEARGSFIGGMLIATVAFAFLFEVDWRFLWPVLMIGAGLLFLLNVILPD